MDTGIFLTHYWQHMTEGNAEEVRTFFDPTAKSYLHDTNEILTVDDWVNHLKNSNSNGDWHVTIDRIDKLETGQIVTITFHRSPNWVGFITSFFTLKADKIIELHEYYCPCDDNVVPQWRSDLRKEERI